MPPSSNYSSAGNPQSTPRFSATHRQPEGRCKPGSASVCSEPSLTINPVLNWANIRFANIGQHSWFLILGELLLREPSSRYSPNCDESIFADQKVSLIMFWEYSPSSANIASGWLRAESSPVDEEEIKIKMETVSTLLSFRMELTYLLTCGRRSLVSGIQNDIVVG